MQIEFKIICSYHTNLICSALHMDSSCKLHWWAASARGYQHLNSALLFLEPVCTFSSTLIFHRLSDSIHLTVLSSWWPADTCRLILSAMRSTAACIPEMHAVCSLTLFVKGECIYILNRTKGVSSICIINTSKRLERACKSRNNTFNCWFYWHFLQTMPTLGFFWSVV